MAGGLGNQLFQFFRGYDTNQKIGFIWGNDARLNENNLPVLSSLNIEVYNCTFERRISHKLEQRFHNLLLKLSDKKSLGLILIKSAICIFGNIYLSFKYRKKVKIVMSDKQTNENDVKCIYYYVGYFQNLHNVNRISKEKIDSLFDVTIGDKARYLKAEMIKKKILLLHIRLGDYVENKNIDLLEEKYYIEVCKKLDELDSYEEIWIFTDDQTLYRRIYESKDYSKEWKLIDTTPLKDFELLELMRNASGLVIANSSLSWWAAKMRWNRSALVFAPKPWFFKIQVNDEFYPDDWKLFERENTCRNL